MWMAVFADVGEPAGGRQRLEVAAEITSCPLGLVVDQPRGEGLNSKWSSKHEFLGPDIWKSSRWWPSWRGHHGGHHDSSHGYGNGMPLEEIMAASVAPIVG
jgi:hypothetical protein